MEKTIKFFKSKPFFAVVAVILAVVLIYKLPTVFMYKFSCNPTSNQKFDQRAVVQTFAYTAIPSTGADLAFKNKSLTYVPKYKGTFKLDCSFDTGPYCEEYELTYRLGKFAMSARDKSDLAEYFIKGSALLPQSSQALTLKQVKVAHALFVFKQPITVEKALSIGKQNKTVKPQWIPIKTADEIDENDVLTGINCGGFEANSFNIQNKSIIKKYPNLNWQDKEKHQTATADDYIAQFKDRMKLLKESETTLNSFIKKPLDLDERMKYIKKNGVKALGIMISGKSDELLKIKSDDIENVVIIYSDANLPTDSLSDMQFTR